MHLPPSLIRASFRCANGGGGDEIDRKYGMVCLDLLLLLLRAQAIFAVGAAVAAAVVVAVVVVAAEPTSFDVIVAFPEVPSTVSAASCVAKERQMLSCY